MLTVKTVTIIGANGNMGAAVAGIFASFGGAKVNLISRTHEKSLKAIEDAVKSVRADSIRDRLIPKTFDDLKECIQEADWIFESVAEDFQVKYDINRTISKYRKTGTFITTGTSGLSIEQLKECFDEDGQKHYLGTHFFNPPYNLPLCEVIPNSLTDQVSLERIINYLERVLFRKVVVVKDSPAFLANRIGFQFLNEAMQFAERNKNQGGIDYIDSLLGPFTGRGLAPLATVDFVGLDIHQAIVDNVYTNTNDFSHKSFILPSFAKHLIKENKLGKKTKEGLYKIIKDDYGNKSYFVYDIVTDNYRTRNINKSEFTQRLVNMLRVGDYEGYSKLLLSSSSDEAKLCRYFLAKYALYSVLVANEVGRGINDADIVMSYGFNWIPPSAVVKIFGGYTNLIKELRYDKQVDEVACKLDVGDEQSTINCSKIDYRKFLRAKYC